MSIRFGVLTVSDSCYAGDKSDKAGAKLIEAVKTRFALTQVVRKLVPDEYDDIVKTLVELTDKVDVVLSTGGTGFSSRDVTPEATRAVIEKEAPGLAYAMVSRSLQITETAMLSRAVCGIRKKSLIINLPGSAKAAVECFGFIQEALPHAVALLADNKNLIEQDHKIIQQEEVKPKFTESKVNLDKVATRSRQSPYPMIEVTAAQCIIFKETRQTLHTDIVPFEESINRIIADDIIAPEHVPPFRASIKDGYAVKSTDQCGVRRVVAVAAAGDEPSKEGIKDGEAMRISTGAPIPEGANAVVQVENTDVLMKTEDDTRELQIQVKVLPIAGQDIREIGSDVKAGECVIKRYSRMSSAHVGILAMLGISEVRIMRAPLIGVISTGNELQPPGHKLKPGQIRDCNKYTLMNFLRKYHYQPRDCGYARDNPNSVKMVLEEAFTENDVVITSGGVSMGEFDIIKEVLIKDFAAIIHFGRVNMKPGKPTTFATLEYKGKFKMFFGLPGNPASCCVTCILFVIPTLRYFERSEVVNFPTASVSYPKLENSDSRPDYQRVKVTIKDNILVGTSQMYQVSSKLNSMAGANGLAVVPGKTGLSSIVGFVYHNRTSPKETVEIHVPTIIFDDM